LIAGPEDIVVDRANRLISTPAYMYQNAKPYQVYKGIGELVSATLNFDADFDSKSSDGKKSDPVLESLLKGFSPADQEKLRKKLSMNKTSSKYNREGALDYKEGEDIKH
jgi:hypothetical protein